MLLLGLASVLAVQLLLMFGMAFQVLTGTPSFLAVLPGCGVLLICLVIAWAEFRKFWSFVDFCAEAEEDSIVTLCGDQTKRAFHRGSWADALVSRTGFVGGRLAWATPPWRVPRAGHM